MIGFQRVLAIAVTSAIAVVNVRGQQRTGVELLLLSPTAETVISGRVNFEAEVRPETTPVRAVDFWVSGEKACTAVARPFRCSWDAGTTSAQRDIAVVAQLADGSRLRHAVRTTAPPEAFRATGNSVLVSVHVRDRSGGFVRGLDASSFQLLEDGVPQEILFLSTDAVPADVLIALDVSGSMAPEVTALKAVASGFLSELQPTDAVALTAFNTTLSVLSPWGADTAARLAALEQLHPAGGTALYDAMIQGADLISSHKGPAGRRAMVVLTDGDDVSSMSSAAAARTELQRRDVVLYVVGLGKAAESERLKEQLMSLTRETGGTAFFAARMSALRDHFREIVANLSNQYVLGYSPKRPIGDGGWRHITVLSTDKTRRYEIRARESYQAVSRAGG